MDSLFRGCDGDYILRSHVRIRSSFTRRRNHGRILLNRMLGFVDRSSRPLFFTEPNAREFKIIRFHLQQQMVHRHVDYSLFK